MEYRINKKTGDRISVIGLGTSYIASASEKDAIDALRFAHEGGINYADLATAGAKTFAYYGKAFADCRKEMLYQVHFGANYETGEYGWTTELDKVKRQIEWMLGELRPTTWTMASFTASILPMIGMTIRITECWAICWR